MDIDVTNKQQLRTLGYKERIYYCGSGCQRLRNWLRESVQKIGIPFPFNPACFKHDYAYSKGFDSLAHKFSIDYEFYADMCKLIPTGKYEKRLKRRALVFYVLVLLATPFYYKNGRTSKTN